MKSNVVVMAAVGLFGVGFASAQVTSRVSVLSNGVQANGACREVVVASGGGHIAFSSQATNLVSGDTSDRWDIFVADLTTGVITRESVDSSGAEANEYSWTPSLSADGRWVAFVSAATNLVPQSGIGHQAYLRDRWLGSTVVLNVDAQGVPALPESGDPFVSDDGRYVAFWSQAPLVAGDGNSQPDVYVRDLLTATTERVSLGLGGGDPLGASWPHAISADGRFVAIYSTASNLVPNDTNGQRDMFVFDRATGSTERISVSSSGVEGNANSGGYGADFTADGRFVVFTSEANNLVAGDTNGRRDAFLRDRLLGTTERMTMAPNGAQSSNDVLNCALSDDGTRFVATMHSPGMPPWIPAWTHVYVRELPSGFARAVALTSMGNIANSSTFGSASSISANGAKIAYWTSASNLVAGDTNGFADVYLLDLGTCPTPLNYCTATVNSLGCTPALEWFGTPSISAPSGFTIRARDVLPDCNGALMYGLSSAAVPFHGGVRCVFSSLRRLLLPPAVAGGSGPCAGVYDVGFDRILASDAGATLFVGQRVFTQICSRDPGSPTGWGLTDALMFVICP